MEDGMDPVLDAPDESGTGPSPDDPILSSDMCAYEVSGVMRMILAGWPGQMLIKMFGMTTSDLQFVLDQAQREQRIAGEHKRPIYAAKIRKESLP